MISRILLDVDRWDRADDATRDAAIAEVARLTPSFDHVRTERFTGSQVRVRTEGCSACGGRGGLPCQSGNSDEDDCNVCDNSHSIEVTTESDPVSHRIAVFVHRASKTEFVLVPGRLELAACLVGRAPVLGAVPPEFRALSPIEHQHLISRACVFDIAFETGTWPHHPFGLLDAGPAARLVYPIAALERAQSDAFHELVDEVGALDPFVPPRCLVRTGYGTAMRRPHGPSHLAFSPDGKWLAESATHDVRISDAATGRQLSRLALARPTDTQPLAIAFSPDSMRVVLASRHDVELYDVATGELGLRIGNGEVTWRSVAWVADGRILLAEMRGTTVVLRLVDPETGETLRTSEWSSGDPANWGVLLATSSDGKRAVVSPRQDGALTVWDVPAWEIVMRVATDGIGALALGSEHVFVSHDRKIRAYRISDGVEHDLAATLIGVVGAAHQTSLVHWTWDKGVGVYDLTKRTSWKPSKHASGTVALSPDGRRIATTVSDHNSFVAIWRVPKPRARK